MTRKHFEKIAATMKESLDASRDGGTVGEACAVQVLIYKLASDFAGFNDNFNRIKFLEACGVYDGGEG
jgi:hypothetical protein